MGLDVQGLFKAYHHTSVIEGVSFAVRPGEIVGLVGLNGAGKSTTLEIICGITPPDQGQVVLDGLSADKNYEDFRKKIAFVPERPGLHGNVSCADFLGFTANAHGKLSAHMLSVAKKTGCQPYLAKPMGVLSRGQRQAVYLAAAFLAAPKLLVLDEPTVGLDPLQQKRILDALRAFCDEGGSVLLSTHALYEAETVCDRVCVLMHKKIIADGPGKEISQKHPDLYIFLEEEQNKVLPKSGGSA